MLMIVRAGDDYRKIQYEFLRTKYLSPRERATGHASKRSKESDYTKNTQQRCSQEASAALIASI